MIALGTYDAAVSKADRERYHQRVRSLTGATVLGQWKTQLREEGRWVDYRPRDADDPMTVVELQRFLRSAGFLPFGTDTGICGYRTSAAIFLFQEYVRTVEGKVGIGFPDGLCGKNTFTHIRRWQAEGMRAG